jgi:hypothetical protein
MSAGAARTVPDDAHEWVSFEDDHEMRTWVFDVTFLTSPWTCIYGNGCQGVLTGPAPELQHGCCSYGAHFVDRADAKRVERIAKTLTDEEWQLRGRAATKGVVKRNQHGELVTRVVDGACIFLNRLGFPTGPGCALHQVAMARSQNPMTLKPEVCWQLPLRREDDVADDGSVTSTIRQWDRRHWGEGGAEFHWWCTESPEAFVGDRPVYQSMEAELTEMVGKKVYRRLAAYLADRTERVARRTPLPHPALRRRAEPAVSAPAAEG